MEWFSDETIRHFVIAYGYSGLALIIALESVGLPLPGETVLLFASVYAGSHPDRLDIVGVISAAAAGATLGGVAGYVLGRSLGYTVLLKWGARVGLTERRIKVGQYLFMEHGNKLVFFGRFIPLLRVMAAFLAGTNRMDVKNFLLFNALSAVMWAGVMGGAAYKFGKVISSASTPIAWTLLALGVSVLLGMTLFLRSNEADLEAKAEKALPGPLQRRSAPLR